MGYGDDLMVTGEVNELLKTRPKEKFIIGDGKKSFWSEIYYNNHSIISAKEINDYEEIIWINNYPHNRPYRIYDKKTSHIKYTWGKSYRVKKGQIFFPKKKLVLQKIYMNKLKKNH